MQEKTILRIVCGVGLQWEREHEHITWGSYVGMRPWDDEMNKKGEWCADGRGLSLSPGKGIFGYWCVKGLSSRIELEMDIGGWGPAAFGHMHFASGTRRDD